MGKKILFFMISKCILRNSGGRGIRVLKYVHAYSGVSSDTECSEVVQALLTAHPGGASTANSTGALPLHLALIGKALPEVALICVYVINSQSIGRTSVIV